MSTSNSVPDHLLPVGAGDFLNLPEINMVAWGACPLPTAMTSPSKNLQLMRGLQTLCWHRCTARVINKYQQKPAMDLLDLHIQSTEGLKLEYRSSRFWTKITIYRSTLSFPSPEQLVCPLFNLTLRRSSWHESISTKISQCTYARFKSDRRSWSWIRILI